MDLPARSLDQMQKKQHGKWGGPHRDHVLGLDTLLGYRPSRSKTSWPAGCRRLVQPHRALAAIYAADQCPSASSYRRISFLSVVRQRTASLSSRLQPCRILHRISLGTMGASSKGREIGHTGLIGGHPAWRPVGPNSARFYQNYPLLGWARVSSRADQVATWLMPKHRDISGAIRRDMGCFSLATRWLVQHTYVVT